MYFKVFSVPNFFLFILTWNFFEYFSNGIDVPSGLAKVDSGNSSATRNCYCDYFYWACDCCPSHPMCKGDTFRNFSKTHWDASKSPSVDEKSYKTNWLSYIVNYAYMTAYDDAFKNTIEFLRTYITEQAENQVNEKYKNFVQNHIIKPNFPTDIKPLGKELMEDISAIIFKKTNKVNKFDLFKELNEFVHQQVLENIHSKFSLTSILGIEITEFDALRLSSCSNVLQTFYLNLMNKFALRKSGRGGEMSVFEVEEIFEDQCSCISFEENCNCCPTHPVCPGGIPLPKPRNPIDNINNLRIMDKTYNEAYQKIIYDLYLRTLKILKEKGRKYKDTFSLEPIVEKLPTFEELNLQKTKQFSKNKTADNNDKFLKIDYDNCAQAIKDVLHDKLIWGSKGFY